MGFSSIVSLAIVFATAATLNANGITDIETSAQAAEALRPIAGQFAFALFALGIIGTGLLAVPVLAGSAAYAVTTMVVENSLATINTTSLKYGMMTGRDDVMLYDMEGRKEEIGRASCRERVCQYV